MVVTEAVETRVVDPTTGGAKGSKPVMLDLVPHPLHVAVTDGPRTTPEDLAERALTSLIAFWGAPDRVIPGRDSSRAALHSATKDICQALDLDLGGHWARMWELAAVYGGGAEKYDAENWRRGYPWTLSFRAGTRHIMLYLMGHSIDTESGRHHLAHAAFHVAALSTFINVHPQMDDRPRSGAE